MIFRKALPVFEHLTSKQAKKFHDEKLYEGMTLDQIAEFQLMQEYLCVPFTLFQEAMEHRLQRPVWTHEFAHPERLREEMFKARPKPTMEDILNLIPKEKQLILL